MIFPDLFRGLLIHRVEVIISVVLSGALPTIVWLFSSLKHWQADIPVCLVCVVPPLTWADRIAGSYRDWQLSSDPSASPSREDGQAIIFASIPAVDVDAASGWISILVTTLMICIYLVIIERAENIPVRKISQHFLFCDPVFSFCLLCFLSGNWDWNSQGLASSADEMILKVSDKIFLISEEEMGEKIICFVQHLKQNNWGPVLWEVPCPPVWSWYLTQK